MVLINKKYLLLTVLLSACSFRLCGEIKDALINFDAHLASLEGKIFDVEAYNKKWLRQARFEKIQKQLGVIYKFNNDVIKIAIYTNEQSLILYSVWISFLNHLMSNRPDLDKAYYDNLIGLFSVPDKAMFEYAIYDPSKQLDAQALEKRDALRWYYFEVIDIFLHQLYEREKPIYKSVIDKIKLGLTFIAKPSQRSQEANDFLAFRIEHQLGNSFTKKLDEYGITLVE